MKIAITGHRPNKLDNDYELRSPLVQAIKDSILKIVKERSKHSTDLTLITGMALGIDTLFAQIAIEYGIPFIAAVPCRDQESRWPERSRKVYREILSKAAEVVYVTDGPYDASCMERRNRWMVNNCDLLIAVWDGSFGGTCNCKSYAEYKGREVVRIDPDEIREVLDLL